MSTDNFNSNKKNDDKNDLVPIFESAVREKRVTSNQIIPLKISINGIFVDLQNISDTGLAFSSIEPFEVNYETQLRIIFSEDQYLDLKGKIIWGREINGKRLYGFHFNHEYLPEGFLEALDRVQLIKVQLFEEGEKFKRIDDGFKKLTYEIENFLELSKKLLDQLEEEILISSENIRNSYREVIKSNLEIDFVGRLKQYSRELDAIFSRFESKEKKQEHIQFFRHHVGNYYTSNPFIARALRKPRGYSGDYEMMSQIYRDGFEGRSFFEMLMHRYGINESSSLSVKYRRGYFVKTISSLSKEIRSYNICSIACGPAKETIDFLKQVSVEESGKYNFYLLDQDIEALLSAKRNICEVIMSRDLKTKVEFLPISVQDIVEFSGDVKKLSQIGFHLIYTAGLYDYLTQPVAKMLTGTLLEWLSPKCKMIIGNFHPSNPTKTISELVADWKLIHRDESQMLDLVDKNRVNDVHIHKDDQDIDLFLEITV